MGVLIENHNQSNAWLCDTKTKLEQGSSINEPQINKTKVNISLITSL